MVKVAVSGYFDPFHVGHLELFEKAKELGDELVVILNNDKQSVLKKGKFFMPVEERKKIIEKLEMVDEVFLSIDDDLSVCKSLAELKPHIFANGGDRHEKEIPESSVCREYGIKMVDGLGEKIQASSSLIKNFKKKVIACDIDGTLAYSDHEVTSEMLDLIRELQKTYDFVTIGGGNIIHLYNQFLKKYMDEVGNDLYVFSLGGMEGYKVNREGMTKLYSVNLTNEEKYKIIYVLSNFIKEKNIIPETYDQIEDRGGMIAFSILGRKASKESKFAYDPDKSIRKSFIEELSKELPEFEMRMGGTTTIDITKKGYNKSYGIKKIQEILDAEFEDIIYFGDDLGEGGNDFPVKDFVKAIPVKTPEDTMNHFKSILSGEDYFKKE